MKLIKIATPVFVLLFLVSCGNKSQKAINNTRNDEIEKAKQDSIEKAKEKERIAWLDSMAVFAWGDAKFGIKEKELSKTKAFSDKNYNQILRESLGLKEGIFHFDFNGKNRGLCSLKISCVHDIDNLDDLISDINVLYNQIKEKYGEPTGVKNSPYSLRKTDIIGSAWIDIAYWNIGSEDNEYGTKHINLSIHKYVGSLYEAFASIHNPRYSKDYKPKTEEDKKREKEHQKAVDEAKEYAF